MNSEEIRAIVKQENTHLETSLAKMTDSIEKLADLTYKNANQAARYEERHQETRGIVDDMNSHLLDLSTRIIPELQIDISNNSLTSRGTLWLGALMATSILSGMFWVFSYYTEIITTTIIKAQG